MNVTCDNSAQKFTYTCDSDWYDANNDISVGCEQGTPYWCATHEPATVGPHMNVTCSDATQTLDISCDEGYYDINGDPSDGCEMTSGELWCQQNMPQVGLHMQVSCNPSTHIYSFFCDAGWVNYDDNIADGCEMQMAPAPLSFEPIASTLLAGSGMMFGGGLTSLTVQADCNGTYQTACAGGTPTDPLPTVAIDSAKRAGDMPTTVVVPDAANSRYEITTRFRLTTADGPIPFTFPGSSANCNLTIDTTKGNTPVLTATFYMNVPADSPDGPTNVSNVSVSGFESADYTLSGEFLCLGSNLPSADIMTVFVPTLESYLEQRGVFCGVVAPEYFVPCAAN
jgi:hypothetical protein